MRLIDVDDLIFSLGCSDRDIYCKDLLEEAPTVIIEAEQTDSVLEDIKAEIKGMTPTYHNLDWSITDLVPISEVLKLIDKHMGGKR